MPYHNSPITHQIKEMEKAIGVQYRARRKQARSELAPQRIELLELRIKREIELGDSMGAVDRAKIEHYKNEIRRQKRL